MAYEAVAVVCDAIGAIVKPHAEAKEAKRAAKKMKIKAKMKCGAIL